MAKKYFPEIWADDFEHTSEAKIWPKLLYLKPLLKMYSLRFYAEIQDGCQKSRENNFWQKPSKSLCVYTLWGQKFHPNRYISHHFWDIKDFSISLLNIVFIAFIHPIQWTIALPVGATGPAKRQKKTSCI